MAGSLVSSPARISKSSKTQLPEVAPVPRPFYQDPFGAALHHAVSLGGDSETLFAYYGALRRVIEILREARA
jgi:hypothetical protein